MSAEIALPCDLPAERLVLGSIILEHQKYSETFNLLHPEDFILEKHRRIYGALRNMDASGLSIDRTTVAGFLNNHQQLESVDGLSYLVSLDDGLPQFPNIEAYIDVIREKSALRKIITTSQHLIDRCVASQGDSKELITLAEDALTKIGYKPEETAEMLNFEHVLDQSGGIDHFINPHKEATFVKTPWDKLTDMTGGYRRKELFLLAGNPSMGKSAAAAQIAMGIAKAGLGVLIFSLEMSRASLFTRMMCTLSRVDASKLRAGYLNQEERSRIQKAIQQILTWPLWIAEHGISTVAAIRAAVRRKKSKDQDVFLVVVDYLQLLQSIGKQANRNSEISEITRQLKLLAVDENVNIHLLSQLNRDNLKERRAPALHDLRDSGSIEQDADAVAFVWRPEMLHREREDLKGYAELLLWKQRNGPTGKIKLTWLGNITAFENAAEEEA
jgi:replicative DNA helicase